MVFWLKCRLSRDRSLRWLVHPGSVPSVSWVGFADFRGGYWVGTPANVLCLDFIKCLVHVCWLSAVFSPDFTRFSPPPLDFTVVFYDHFFVKSELLVRDLPKPCSFWELDQEVQVKSWAAALNIDLDRVAELISAFQEPSTAASAYKVPAEFCTSLLKTPKVEEEWLSRSELSVP